MIVEHVWDMDYDGLTNIVDVYIRHLRSKIDDKFPVKMIHTVRGIGYMLEAPEKAAEKGRATLMIASARQSDLPAACGSAWLSATFFSSPSCWFFWESSFGKLLAHVSGADGERAGCRMGRGEGIPPDRPDRPRLVLRPR